MRDATPAQRALRLRNSRSVDARACEAAIEASHEARFADVEVMLSHARVAAEMAGARPDFPRLLRAQAYATLGNALRITDDFDAAERSFEQATALLLPSAPLTLRAHVLSLRASLRECQRQLPAALELLRKADDLYRRSSDLMGRCRVKVQIGIVLGHAGEPEAAIRAIADACEFMRRGLREERVNTGVVTPETENLARAALYNLVSRLVEAGFYDEAENRLHQVAELFDRGGALFTAKLSWLQARLAAARGHIDGARHRFCALLSFYTGRHMTQEAAHASLELALLEASCGRWDDVTRLTGVVRTLFVGLGLANESTASRLLRSAAEQQSVQALRDLLQACGSPPLLRRVLAK